MLKKYLQKILSALSKSQKTFIAFGVIAVLLIIATVVDYSYNNSLITNTNNYYKVFNVRVSKILFFADEKVPVENKEVRELVAREIIKITALKQQSLLIHQRAALWFPIIEPILKKHNVPEDFKYIALVESKLSNTSSPKGANGFWQFIESTAVQYGLEISEDVDERNNVIKSTEAACCYFNEAYKQLNNWTLVAASYNKGIGGIQNQLSKQKMDNYYSLKLTKETGRYVYKILAMKELIIMPKVYGLKIRKKKYNRYTTKKITVDSSISDLSAFSETKGSDVVTLKLMNPWLISNKLTNESKKTYTIELPLQNKISNTIKNNLTNAIGDTLKTRNK